jgi:hypothetical protein
LPWHLTTLLNGVLTIGLFYLIDGLMHDFDERGRRSAEASVRLRLVRCGFRLRGALSFYNWTCFLYLLLPALAQIDFPPITWRLLP